MKKNSLFFIELFALVGFMSLASCTKENLGNGTQFHATMEGCTDQNSKTILNGTSLEWVSGEQIAIYGTVGGGIYSATPQTPATVAVFDNVSGETGSAPFRAFYPTTLSSNGVNVTLPKTQTYVEGSINEFPMYAESSTNELSFKNVCGVLKLHLTKANTNISSIAITAASEINGTFSIDYNGGDPELEYVSGGTKTTKLICTTAQSIANGKDFYIYLPEGTYSGLEIVLNTDEGGYCMKTAKASRPVSVVRSRYTLITLGSDDLTFTTPQLLTGLFSISETEQVHFAKGNLQYRASTGSWRFAEHQWDYVGTQTADGGGYYGGTVSGSDNNYISDTYNGWIDLFGWGTGNNPTLTTMGYDYYDDYSTFTDWGDAISGGNNASNPWRTLSKDEWYYLYRSRTGATTKRGVGMVNGVFGAIFLPDNWTAPAGVSFTSDYNVLNRYDADEWAAMEAAGALFLPAAGYRGLTTVENAGHWGYYWESTQADNGTQARYLSVKTSLIGGGTVSATGTTDPWFGYSVRLVRN